MSENRRPAGGGRGLRCTVYYYRPVFSTDVPWCNQSTTIAHFSVSTTYEWVI